MICWQVIIDEIDVSAFVPQDSLDGLTIKVEGNHLFDYKTNDISFDMDIKALELFELLPTEFDQLKHSDTNHRPVSVYYYGRKCFGGFVGNLVKPHNSHFLQVDAVSIDTMIVKTLLDTDYLYSDYPESGIESFSTSRIQDGGDTLTSIVARVISRVNNRATLSGGPSLLNSVPSIDVEDFVSYGYWQVVELETPAYVVSGGTYLYPSGIFRELETEKIFLLYIKLGSSDIYHWGWAELTEDGPADTIEIRETYIEGDTAYSYDSSSGYASSNLTPVAERLSNWDDDEISVAVENQLNTGGASLLAEVKIGETYFGIYQPNLWFYTFFKVILNPTDQYQYTYSKPTAGEVLRDLGIMTDSLVWIDPDGVFHLQSRAGLGAIPTIPEGSAQVSTRTLDRRKEKLELPDAFNIPASVRTQMVDHYDPVYRGDFNRHEIIVEQEDVAGQTLPLRTIHIGEKDFGVVKEVILKENLIELTTEKRL